MLRSRVHWATTSRLETGKEKSVANGIDSIGSKGILVLLLQRDQT